MRTGYTSSSGNLHDVIIVKPASLAFQEGGITLVSTR